MKRLQVFAVLLFTVLSINHSVAQDRPMHEVHSMMVYNFMKYINWPSNSSQGDFVIGIMGDDDVYSNLHSWYEGKPKGSQTIVIKKINSTIEAEKCHVIYVAKDMSNSFTELQSKLDGKSTLVITDKTGLGQKGSGINFKTVGGKLKFEMNESALAKANLKVSSQLTAMAILI